MKTIDGYFFLFLLCQSCGYTEMQAALFTAAHEYKALYSGTNVKNGDMLRQRTAYCKLCTTYCTFRP